MLLIVAAGLTVIDMVSEFEQLFPSVPLRTYVVLVEGETWILAPVAMVAPPNILQVYVVAPVPFNVKVSPSQTVLEREFIWTDGNGFTTTVTVS